MVWEDFDIIIYHPKFQIGNLNVFEDSSLYKTPLASAKTGWDINFRINQGAISDASNGSFPWMLLDG